MTESVGFQYWRDSSMLLGVNSKNQENMREDWKNLMNENKFYLRKMKKMQKKMKEMEQEIRELKDRLHWKDKEIKSYEKGMENDGQIALAREAKIKKLQEELEKSQKNLIIANKDLAYFKSLDKRKEIKDVLPRTPQHERRTH
jgi:chromosome segregation ATPase